MEAEVDHSQSYDEPPRPDTTLNLQRILRFFEMVVFCCLSAIALFWTMDRVRQIDFPPFYVEPCTDEHCVFLPDAADRDGAVWLAYQAALSPAEVVTFSPRNICREYAGLLWTRANDPDVQTVVADLQRRGVMQITYLNDTKALISPGERNDQMADLFVEAFWLGQPRSCYASNYTGLVWPLAFAWVMLVAWRFVRALEVRRLAADVGAIR